MNWMAKSRPGASSSRYRPHQAQARVPAAASTNLKVRTLQWTEGIFVAHQRRPARARARPGSGVAGDGQLFPGKGLSAFPRTICWAPGRNSSPPKKSACAPRLSPRRAIARACLASALADKFLENCTAVSPESFNGVLAWDLLDYFDPAVELANHGPAFQHSPSGRRGAGAVS